MFRKFLLSLVALGMLALVIGCSQNPTANKQINNNISSQFGGYTTANEAPAFGNRALATSVDQEKSFADPMSSLAVLDSISANPSSGIFRMRIVWGRLMPDSSVKVVTDWSGSLATTRGVELLARTIRFEANDSILTRTDPKVIAWVSQTTTGSDGIAANIFIPRAFPTIDTTITIKVDTLGDTTKTIVIDTIPPVPATVTFNTAPYSRTFTLAELVKLDTIITLSDSNAIAFHAFRVTRISCPRGFLSGDWGGTDSLGQMIFSGTFTSQEFGLKGFVMGTFGTNDSGVNVFFGKWIDNNGFFQGLLRGYWGTTPNHHANDRAKFRAGGWFVGGVFDGNATLIGELSGKFKRGDSTHVGFFQGRWRLNCPNEFLDATVNGDDDDIDQGPDGRFMDRPSDFENWHGGHGGGD